MNRALLALFAGPLLIASAYGFLALFAIPIMLSATALFGLPALFLLRKFQRLSWPHAVFVGLLASIPYVALYLLTSEAHHVQYTGLRNSLLLVGTGSAAGLAFWWLGVFRNPAFPFVPTGVPWSMLVLVPLSAGGVYYWQLLEPKSVYGEVLAIVQSGSPDRAWSGTVSMRLSSGAQVLGLMPWTLEGDVPVGRCYWASERRSASLRANVYFLHSPRQGPCP